MSLEIAEWHPMVPITEFDSPKHTLFLFLFFLLLVSYLWFHSHSNQIHQARRPSRWKPHNHDSRENPSERAWDGDQVITLQVNGLDLTLPEKRREGEMLCLRLLLAMWFSSQPPYENIIWFSPIENFSFKIRYHRFWYISRFDVHICCLNLNRRFLQKPILPPWRTYQAY